MTNLRVLDIGSWIVLSRRPQQSRSSGKGTILIYFFYFFNASDKVSICSCRGVGTRTLSVIKTNKFCWIALIFILVWLALLVDLSLFNFDQGRVFEGV